MQLWSSSKKLTQTRKKQKTKNKIYDHIHTVMSHLILFDNSNYIVCNAVMIQLHSKFNSNDACVRAHVCVWYFCIYLIYFIIAFHSAFIITCSLCWCADWSEKNNIHFLILNFLVYIFLGNIHDWWEIWAVHTPPHWKEKIKFVYVLFVHVYL